MRTGYGLAAAAFAGHARLMSDNQPVNVMALFRFAQFPSSSFNVQPFFSILLAAKIRALIINFVQSYTALTSGLYK
jgi:hypothetical protein